MYALYVWHIAQKPLHHTTGDVTLRRKNQNYMTLFYDINILRNNLFFNSSYLSFNERKIITTSAL